MRSGDQFCVLQSPRTCELPATSSQPASLRDRCRPRVVRGVGLRYPRGSVERAFEEPYACAVGTRDAEGRRRGAGGGSPLPTVVMRAFTTLPQHGWRDALGCSNGRGFASEADTRGWAVPGSNRRPPACKARAAAAICCPLRLESLCERQLAGKCCALLQPDASTSLPCSPPGTCGVHRLSPSRGTSAGYMHPTHEPQRQTEGDDRRSRRI